MKLARMILGTLAVATITAGAALAEGNLASRATRLEPLQIKGDLTFEPKEFQLETGKYYRWRIESDGGDEFMIQAPELFRNVWINQIVVNDLEVHTSGAIYGVEFDDEGTIDIWFVPIRPGEYEYYARGYQSRGMTGKFVVR